MSVSVSVERFSELLVDGLCTRETSANPVGWTPENPTWGHCAVVALVAQNLFGGEIVRAPLDRVPAFAHMRSHYWNFIDGNHHDFTIGQFKGGLAEASLIGTRRARHELLEHLETKRRYKELAYRFASKVTPSPLFQDGIYEACFKAALESPCQKMKFGVAMVIENDLHAPDNIIHESCNDTIGPLASLCQPTCIRFGIQSRTESMIGACGHAEELALAFLHKQGIKPSSVTMFIAGLHANGIPWFRNERVHTCLRCSVQMHNAGLGQIAVSLQTGWEVLTTEEALIAAKYFALGAKKV